MGSVKGVFYPKTANVAYSEFFANKDVGHDGLDEIEPETPKFEFKLRPSHRGWGVARGGNPTAGHPHQFFVFIILLLDLNFKIKLIF